jgi:hypothetical protein
LHTEYELEMWEHQPLWVVLLPPFGKEKGWWLYTWTDLHLIR